MTERETSEQLEAVKLRMLHRMVAQSQSPPARERQRQPKQRFVSRSLVFNAAQSLETRCFNGNIDMIADRFHRHVKCDATLPACMRCKGEGKPCFYAKSRRGIRDPKKRSLIFDKPPTLPDSGSNFQVPKIPSLHAPSPYIGETQIAGWNLHSKQPSISQTAEENMLLNAYYTHFHQGHPVIPPKRFFLGQVESDPDSNHFLLSVINFVGSIYLSYPLIEDLREAAYAAACGPLPMTAQSVQGLFILSIAAMGEVKLEYHSGWANRAVSMALEIGMQHKAFAATAQSPVIAESYRRTYWSLYNLDTWRWVREGAKPIYLHEIATDVDLPCEEWEYESGRIPPPMSLEEYEMQNNMGSKNLSSFAYLVDIYRISANFVLPYVIEAPEKKKKDLFDRADSLIIAWLIKVPKWKMDLVDSNGVTDLILFNAISLAYQNRLILRQSVLRQNFDVRRCLSLGPTVGPHRQAQKVKEFGWNAIPVDVQAANAVCDLFRFAVPIKSLSPTYMSAMVRMALVYLDACVFLGLNTPQIREKLNMVLHIIATHGETWQLSRNIADEIREVTREYLSEEKSPPSDLDISSAEATESWVAAISTGVLSDDALMGSDFTFPPLYPVLDHMNGWTTNHNPHQIQI